MPLGFKELSEKFHPQGHNPSLNSLFSCTRSTNTTISDTPPSRRNTSPLVKCSNDGLSRQGCAQQKWFNCSVRKSESLCVTHLPSARTLAAKPLCVLTRGHVEVLHKFPLTDGGIIQEKNTGGCLLALPSAFSDLLPPFNWNPVSVTHISAMHLRRLVTTNTNNANLTEYVVVLKKQTIILLTN